ncbi:MAG: AMP-binding protein [Pseudomonadota bacterium]
MTTIASLLEERARQRPEQIYLDGPVGRETYAQINRRVNRAAALLTSLGLAKGGRAALLLGNCPQFLHLWWGLMKLGAVMVPVNLRLTAREAAYVINHSGAQVAVLGPASRGMLAELKPACPEVRHWLDQDDLAALTNLPGQDPPAAAQADDPAAILYTSGTTGFPKGVLHSQANYLRTARAFVETAALVESDRLFTANPLFHVNAQFYSALGSMLAGATLILAEKFSASRLWGWTRQYQANKAVMLLALTTILYNQEPRPDDADNPLDLVVAGGAPKGHYQDFERRFGVRLQTLYSLSESPLALMGRQEEDCLEGSVGRPMLTPASEPNQVQVFDDQDRRAPAGQPGQIVIKNSAMMLGYYQDPEATEQALAGGWLHTGDRGSSDAQGHIYFLGRLKDVIRKKGENVSAAEVEAIIAGHPAVLEAAVLGVETPDALGEEEILACLAWKPGQSAAWPELVAHCAALLADFKVPRLWLALESLPKNAMNRVVKAELKSAVAKLAAGDLYDRGR